MNAVIRVRCILHFQPSVSALTVVAGVEVVYQRGGRRIGTIML